MARIPRLFSNLASFGEVFEDVNDQLFFWYTLMKSIADEHAPIKTKRVSSQDVPYMTTKWKNAIPAKR